ncbi:unnamed protein product [Symbiodinium sp. CCMP2592]|nr:unnamed protein product [Symbiodinium sp. CCMP2592]
MVEISLRSGERVEKGDEPNPLVRNFFDQPASAAFTQTALHRAANCHNFRQEVSESMAIVGSLRKWRQWDDEALHFVDLCCGSAMTATFLALSAPKSTVTAVDIRPPQHLPHFREAGIANVRYLCEDMTRPGFLDVMEKALLDVALPAIVLGMHCCGALSVVATQIYNRFPQCVAILLCPCCLLRGIDVKRADSLMPEVPKHTGEKRVPPANNTEDSSKKFVYQPFAARAGAVDVEKPGSSALGFAADHVQGCQENAARISEEPAPWEAVAVAK